MRNLIEQAAIEAVHSEDTLFLEAVWGPDYEAHPALAKSIFLKYVLQCQHTFLGAYEEYLHAFRTLLAEHASEPHVSPKEPVPPGSLARLLESFETKASEILKNQMKMIREGLSGQRAYFPALPSDSEEKKIDGHPIDHRFPIKPSSDDPDAFKQTCEANKEKILSEYERHFDQAKKDALDCIKRMSKYSLQVFTEKLAQEKEARENESLEILNKFEKQAMRINSFKAPYDKHMKYRLESIENWVGERDDDYGTIPEGMRRFHWSMWTSAAAALNAAGEGECDLEAIKQYLIDAFLNTFIWETTQIAVDDRPMTTLLHQAVYCGKTRALRVLMTSCPKVQGVPYLDLRYDVLSHPVPVAQDTTATQTGEPEDQKPVFFYQLRDKESGADVIQQLLSANHDQLECRKLAFQLVEQGAVPQCPLQDPRTSRVGVGAIESPFVLDIKVQSEPRPIKDALNDWYRRGADDSSGRGGLAHQFLLLQKKGEVLPSGQHAPDVWYLVAPQLRSEQKNELTDTDCELACMEEVDRLNGFLPPSYTAQHIDMLLGNVVRDPSIRRIKASTIRSLTESTADQGSARSAVTTFKTDYEQYVAGMRRDLGVDAMASVQFTEGNPSHFWEVVATQVAQPVETIKSLVAAYVRDHIDDLVRRYRCQRDNLLSLADYLSGTLPRGSDQSVYSLNAWLDLASRTLGRQLYRLQASTGALDRFGIEVEGEGAPIFLICENKVYAPIAQGKTIEEVQEILNRDKPATLALLPLQNTTDDRWTLLVIDYRRAGLVQHLKPAIHYFDRQQEADSQVTTQPPEKVSHFLLDPRLGGGYKDVPVRTENIATVYPGSKDCASFIDPGTLEYRESYSDDCYVRPYACCPHPDPRDSGPWAIEVVRTLLACQDRYCIDRDAANQAPGSNGEWCVRHIDIGHARDMHQEVWKSRVNAGAAAAAVQRINLRREDALEAGAKAAFDFVLEHACFRVDEFSPTLLQAICRLSEVWNPTAPSAAEKAYLLKLILIRYGLKEERFETLPHLALQGDEHLGAVLKLLIPDIRNPVLWDYRNAYGVSMSDILFKRLDAPEKGDPYVYAMPDGRRLYLQGLLGGKMLSTINRPPEPTDQQGTPSTDTDRQKELPQAVAPTQQVFEENRAIVGRGMTEYHHKLAGLLSRDSRYLLQQIGPGMLERFMRFMHGRMSPEELRAILSGREEYANMMTGAIALRSDHRLHRTVSDGRRQGVTRWSRERVRTLSEGVESGEIQAAGATDPAAWRKELEEEQRKRRDEAAMNASLKREKEERRQKEEERRQKEEHRREAEELYRKQATSYCRAVAKRGYWEAEDILTRETIEELIVKGYLDADEVARDRRNAGGYSSGSGFGSSSSDGSGPDASGSESSAGSGTESGSEPEQPGPEPTSDETGSGGPQTSSSQSAGGDPRLMGSPKPERPSAGETEESPKP